MKASILEIRSELGAGTRGASLGPQAVMIASLVLGSGYFKRYKVKTLQQKFEHLVGDIQFPTAKRIRAIGQMNSSVILAVSSIIKEKKFPIVLSGDHSLAAGTIAALKKSIGNAKLGVIWIDAHFDLHSPYTSPSGNVHGMPLAAALGLDNMRLRKNDLNPIAEKAWIRLKKQGGVFGKIDPKHLLFYGVRDFESEEAQIVKEHEIKNFTVEEVRKKGIESAVLEGMARLIDTDYIYISFDVDSLDPDITSYGTGTPVKGGFTPREAIDLIQSFTHSGKVICFEMVEVNPLLDKQGNKMAETAFEVLDAVTPNLEKYGKKISSIPKPKTESAPVRTIRKK
ncbi:MAG: arginase [Flavobacteriales bacterium]|nr:arginase [Flavobacteriales bacterium]